MIDRQKIFKYHFTKYAFSSIGLYVLTFIGLLIVPHVATLTNHAVLFNYLIVIFIILITRKLVWFRDYIELDTESRTTYIYKLLNFMCFAGNITVLFVDMASEHDNSLILGSSIIMMMISGIYYLSANE